MSKKSAKQSRQKSQGRAVSQTDGAKVKKAGNLSGIVIGVIMALVIFSFSGVSQNTRVWTEGVGTVIRTYTILEEKNEGEAAAYADIQFVDSAGETRTERSNALQTDMTEFEGKTVEIKYNSKGTGVLVIGNEKKTSLEWTHIAFIVAAIFIIVKISDVIKKSLPTPEEYAKRRNKCE